MDAAMFILSIILGVLSSRWQHHRASTKYLQNFGQDGHSEPVCTESRSP